MDNTWTTDREVKIEREDTEAERHTHTFLWRDTGRHIVTENLSLGTANIVVILSSSPAAEVEETIREHQDEYPDLRIVVREGNCHSVSDLQKGTILRREEDCLFPLLSLSFFSVLFSCDCLVTSYILLFLLLLAAAHNARAIIFLAASPQSEKDVETIKVNNIQLSFIG